MVTSMPRQNRNRTSGDGESRPVQLPAKRGSRSMVTRASRPCSSKVCVTAINAVLRMKSSRMTASNRIDVPTSTTLKVSTTCCCLPSRSAGTLDTSFKSHCQLLIGSGRSTGVYGPSWVRGKCAGGGPGFATPYGWRWEDTARWLSRLDLDASSRESLWVLDCVANSLGVVTNLQNTFNHLAMGGSRWRMFLII
jgi:hypothetical protein